MASLGGDLHYVLAHIIEVDAELKPLLPGGRPVIVAHPPAPPERIAQLKAAEQYVVGPTYQRLLSIHDGLDNFYWNGAHLLSSRQLLEQPDCTAAHAQPDTFLFMLGRDRSSVGFDLNTRRNDGEMFVVEFDAKGETAERWPSLTNFLWTYVERLEAWLEQARGDARS